MTGSLYRSLNSNSLVEAHGQTDVQMTNSESSLKHSEYNEILLNFVNDIVEEPEEFDSIFNSQDSEDDVEIHR